MSQERFGEIIDRTHQQVQKYEKGMSRVSASKLQEAADALNARIDDFFTGMPRTAIVTARKISREAKAFSKLSKAKQRKMLARAKLQIALENEFPGMQHHQKRVFTDLIECSPKQRKDLKNMIRAEINGFVPA